MKKIFTLFVFAFAAFAVSANDKALLMDDDARQAIYGALDQAKGALKAAPFGKAPVAVLPLKSHHSLLVGRLKNMIVNAGFVCVEGKNDPMWDKIMEEIEWNERKNDILDAKTIMRFGKLKSAKILFQCSVRLIDKNADRVYAEVELRATEINTGRILWGNTFAHRHCIGKNIQGIISIDNDLAMLLKKNFKEAGKSLTSPAVAEKIKSIKTVAVLPFSGDVDSYVTGQAIEMISQTRLYPKNSPIPSLAQARSAARDGLLGSDAICYGSVRSLHTTRPVETQTKDKKVLISRSVFADIYFFIEEGKTGNILWSKTVRLHETIVSGREMTAAELQQFRKDKLDGVPGEIGEEVADNWKSYLLILCIIAGGIILLVFIFFIVKAYLLYHHVR